MARKPPQRPGQQEQHRLEKNRLPGPAIDIGRQRETRQREPMVERGQIGHQATARDHPRQTMLHESAFGLARRSHAQTLQKGFTRSQTSRRQPISGFMLSFWPAPRQKRLMAL